MLKRKISMLENSVKLTKDNNHIWTGGPDDLSYLVGYHPFASETEEFSFHNRYTPFQSHCVGTSRHYGPLSWIALIKIDNAIRSMLSYQHRNAKMKRHFLRDKEQPDMPPSDKLFKDKLHWCDAFYDNPLKEDSQASEETRRIRQKINERAKIVGLTTVSGGIDPLLPVVDKIELVLPTKKVTWLLLDRFFDRVVIFFPFVDEFEFLEHMERLLGPRSYEHEKFGKLNIEKKTDLPHLGMLVLFLRFAYLTLFSNIEAENEAKFNSTDTNPEVQTEKFLMHNPVDIDVLEVAEACLHQFSFLRYCTLPVLQLALYIKLYYTYSPENGEVPEDSHLLSYTALLVHMATSLGLHRDPDNFDVPIRSDRENNLCRKIWSFLVVLDMNGAIANGTPISISRDLFDTKPPYSKPGNENLRNPQMEKAVIEDAARLELAYEPLYRLIELITSVHAMPISKLTKRLDAVEADFAHELSHFDSHLRLDCTLRERCANAARTKIYFKANFFLLGANYHLFNYYENKNNLDLAYFYLKKVIVVAVYNMMPFYEDYVEKSSAYFAGTTDIAITPSFQSLIHKCMVVIQSVMARARFSVLYFESLATHSSSLLTDPDYKTRYELIQRTFHLAYRCLRVITDTLSKLTSRYYYSWRCVKAQIALRQTFNGTDYYLNWCKGKECYIKFTNEMLEDLNVVLQSSLDRVSSAKNEPLTPAPEPQQEASAANAMTVESDYSTQGPPDLMPSANGDNSRLPSVNGGSSRIPSVEPSVNINMPYQATDIDNMWMLMMTEKPQRTRSGLYNQTPPLMDIDYELGTFDHLIYENWDQVVDAADINTDPVLEPASFLDSQNFEEIIRLGP